MREGMSQMWRIGSQPHSLGLALPLARAVEKRKPCELLFLENSFLLWCHDGSIWIAVVWHGASS
jgi:hypothetical protein